MDRQDRLNDPSLDGQSEAEKETIRIYKDRAQQLSALADSNRLMMISVLLDGSASASALAQSLRVDVADVSHHLGILKQAGLVIVERDGSQRIYSLAPGVGIPAEFGSPARIMLGDCVIELGESS
jgi:ArsR family transcriptional regulator, nickel/cobalt-responsive transcriptional repressor